MNKIVIGNRLRKLRGERTINSVADNVGISKSALTMYETGNRIPRDDIKARLADFYGVSVDSLFFS